MLNVRIKREEKSVIEATGSVVELMADIAVLVSGVYTQFLNASPDTAELLRSGLTKMVNDENGPMWTPMDGQTGIIFPKNN